MHTGRHRRWRREVDTGNRETTDTYAGRERKRRNRKGNKGRCERGRTNEEILQKTPER